MSFVQEFIKTKKIQLDRDQKIELGFQLIIFLSVFTSVIEAIYSQNHGFSNFLSFILFIYLLPISIYKSVLLIKLHKSKNLGPALFKRNKLIVLFYYSLTLLVFIKLIFWNYKF